MDALQILPNLQHLQDLVKPSGDVFNALFIMLSKAEDGKRSSISKQHSISLSTRHCNLAALQIHSYPLPHMHITQGNCSKY